MLTLSFYSWSYYQTWLIGMEFCLHPVQVYCATVAWHQLKSLLGYHRLHWPQEKVEPDDPCVPFQPGVLWSGDVPPETRIDPKMLVLTSCLRKGKFSRKNATANHVEKKFPLSETFQEFQIQFGDIRRKLKPNLKSPPTFLLLFLQNDYCSWSTYWQIFQKWATICLKNTFLLMMELVFFKE